MDAESDLILGVQKRLIEQYLWLIKNHYRQAEKATYFLEQRAGIVSLVSMTNVRDALSHLVTLLDDRTPPDKREAQLVSAEEHLRRAILEPYSIAVNRQSLKVKELYEQYKKHLLPVKDKHMALLGAPNEVSINSVMNEVYELVCKGRSAKAKNLWDPTWEEGVAALVEAFARLSQTHQILESYWNKFEHIRSEQSQSLTQRKQSKIAIWGLVLAVVSFLSTLLLTLVPNLALHLRQFLKLG